MIIIAFHCISLHCNDCISLHPDLIRIKGCERGMKLIAVRQGTPFISSQLNHSALYHLALHCCIMLHCIILHCTVHRSEIYFTFHWTYFQLCLSDICGTVTLQGKHIASAIFHIAKYHCKISQCINMLQLHGVTVL